MMPSRAPSALLLALRGGIRRGTAPTAAAASASASILQPRPVAGRARHQGPGGRERLGVRTPSPGLPHDVGGDPSLSSRPVPPRAIEDPDGLLDWEVRCHSLFAVLAVKGLVSTDGLRRSIEALTPSQYASWTYYEKWSAGMTTLLVEDGTVSTSELSAFLFGEEDAAGGSSSSSEKEPLFRAGDFVRVRSHRQSGKGGGRWIEWRRPHVRVPGYVYGARGVIERACGVHGDPSFLAFGLDAPRVRLYRVRFRMEDVWPERYSRREGGGGDDDVIEVEVYEPWLEPSAEPSGHDFEGAALFDHSDNGSDCVRSVGGEDDHEHSHHSHSHDHYHGDHSHDPRPDVERRAANLEGEPRPGEELFSALLRVLIDKGLVSPGEVTEMVEKLTMAGRNLNGAALVARAWTDPAFEERLMDDAPSAAAELGIITSNPNAPTVLTVVKNTPDVHNLVVCTLCSCFPSGLLGIAPSWYKSREYRARAVRDPRGLLLEFGTRVPDGTRVRVHDSTADHRYLVLPRRPEWTAGWTEERLRGLVTRDSMVGVSLLSPRDDNCEDRSVGEKN